MPEEKLKPCPFCGAEAETLTFLFLDRNGEKNGCHRVAVACKKCKSSVWEDASKGVSYYKARELAADKWNSFYSEYDDFTKGLKPCSINNNDECEACQ